MELLERYLHQVKRYLPKKDKADTINELRSLIYEQLDNDQSNDPEEEKLIRILHTFGSPKQVSLRYKEETRYIAKELEPLMLMVMKIVTISLPFALILSRLISYFSENQDYNSWDILLDMLYFIPNIITAVLSALAMVFIVFYLLSRTAKLNFIIEHEGFEPKLLPPVPKDEFKVGKVEEMITIVGSIIFLYIINLQPGLIAVYYNGEATPLLNITFERILPFMNINIILTMCISIYHLAKNEKTLLTAVFELFSHILGGIILILLASSDIFNVTLLQSLGLEFIITILTIMMYVGAIGSFIGGIVTFVKMLLVYNE